MEVKIIISNSGTKYRVFENGLMQKYIGYKKTWENVFIDLSTGYAKVIFNSRYVYLHRLMIEQFTGIINKSLDVNHKNGIKTDNHIDNLEYCTRSENIKHAYDTGLRVSNKLYNIAAIKKLRESGLSYQKIGGIIGCDGKTIWNYVNLY